MIKLILLKRSDREDHALNSLACLMLDLYLAQEMFSTGRQCKGKIYQIWPFCRSQDHSCDQLGFTNDLLVRSRSLSKCVLGIDLCYLPGSFVQEEAVVRYLP